MPDRMREARLAAVDWVPTLTEVLDVDDHGLLSKARFDALLHQQVTPVIAAADDLSAEVLFELEQRIDSLFEPRLREALAPALARASNGLIRVARLELLAALRDLMEDTVTRARALARRTHL